MQTITAVIPAKDEEKNIERCIKSVGWCNKVIVMWMGNDRTGTIAKRLGVEVIQMNKKGTDDFVAVQKNINWAIVHASTDWILRIDADEVVTDNLRQEIVKVLNSSTKNVAYGIPRSQYFLGKFLKGGDWAYDRLIRLFKPTAAYYRQPHVAVHEQLKVTGKIGYLTNRLLHYSHPTVRDVINKFQKYTDVEVNDMHDSAPSAIFKLLTQPPYVFLRWLIWHRGYRDGFYGAVAGGFRAWYELILYKKYLRKLSLKNE